MSDSQPEDPIERASGKGQHMDAGVTPELFREWRSPRFGASNPERMNNPVWEWLVRSGVSAFTATEQFSGPDAFDAGPGWCFDRFGQSSTELADGRTVLIGGEHEDSYDPDFYIYNDVVILHTDGAIDICGYPRAIFSPTDFHTATLLGNRIVIIGNLGYAEDRKLGTTPIAALDLDTFAISSIVTSGTPPGWLHRHNTLLSEDGSSILVRQGKVHRSDEDGFPGDNIDDWRLHVADWRWERLTNRPWRRWVVRRKDRKTNNLWEIRQALFCREMHWEQDLQQQMERLTAVYGIQPNLDAVATLYQPEIPHESLPKSSTHNIYKIKIAGVLVRYVEESHLIQVTVEGELPQASFDALTSDLLRKVGALENAPYELKEL